MSVHLHSAALRHLHGELAEQQLVQARGIQTLRLATETPSPRPLGYLEGGPDVTRRRRHHSPKALDRLPLPPPPPSPHLESSQHSGEP